MNIYDIFGYVIAFILLVLMYLERSDRKVSG